MTTIYVRALDQVLEATISPRIASGNRETVLLRVEFSEHWDGFAKSAVFYTSKNPVPYSRPLSVNGLCTIPAEVLADECRLFISLQGVNSSTGAIKATLPVKYKVDPGAPPLVISDPTPDVYQELLTAYGNTVAMVNALSLANEQAIAVERARIDVQLALEDGSTTGDAELQDMRVDEYGKTHESAGTAVREALKKKAEKTEINRFLRNDVFSELDIAFEIGDVFGNYQGGKWTNYTSEPFTLAAGDYTLIVPKLDIPAMGNACLEYEGGVTDAALRLLSPTEPGAYYFYHTAENADKKLVFRIRVSNDTEPAYREYRAYSPIVLFGDSKRKTIIPDYLTNLSVLFKDKLTEIRGKNLFDKNAEGIVYGKYLGGNGITIDNANLAITDYIPVEPNTAYVASGYNIQGACVHFYNEYKRFIGSVHGFDIVNNCVTTPEKCCFLQWSVAIANLDVFQIEQGETPTDYEPFTEYKPIIELDKKIESYARAAGVTEDVSNVFSASSASLAAGASVVAVDRVDVKKNKTYVFTAKPGASVNIRISHGETEYGGSYLDINDTTVTAFDVTNGATQTMTAAHGLNISGFLTVIVKVGTASAATVTIFTAGGMFKSEEFSWTGCNGSVRARNNGATITDCSYSLTLGDIDAPVWLFGDSYIGLTNAARWPSYLLNMGFDNWLACGYPGGGSYQELASFERLLEIGKPKFVVWSLGMNNGDEGAINPKWLEVIERVIELCEKNKIKLILATIPSCPQVDNSYKNAWVKASGYRYIDFARAVSANSNATWYDGMLSGDNIHPTELGAQALASRVLCDFPEIAN